MLLLFPPVKNGEQNTQCCNGDQLCKQISCNQFLPDQSRFYKDILTAVIHAFAGNDAQKQQ